jgi:hypothetical protein
MTQIAQMQKSILHLYDLCHLWLFLDFGVSGVRLSMSSAILHQGVLRVLFFFEDPKRRCL